MFNAQPPQIPRVIEERSGRRDRPISALKRRRRKTVSNAIDNLAFSTDRTITMTPRRRHRCHSTIGWTKSSYIVALGIHYNNYIRGTGIHYRRSIDRCVFMKRKSKLSLRRTLGISTRKFLAWLQFCDCIWMTTSVKSTYVYAGESSSFMKTAKRSWTSYPSTYPLCSAYRRYTLEGKGWKREGEEGEG